MSENSQKLAENRSWEFGKGRPKGVPNKATAAVKDMVVKALEGVGGVEYLMAQAHENPKAFLSLVGRVIPVQVQGDASAPFVIQLTHADAKL